MIYFIDNVIIINILSKYLKILVSSFMLPKLVITDIDGVWTDGGMFYGEAGGEWKKFNTSDSAGVLFLRTLGIPVAIMTGENSQAVKRRSEKLKIEYLYLAAKNKLQLATDLCQKLNISLAEVAFIGDDMNDYHLLKAVGISATPSNAPSYMQSIVDHPLSVKGGDGAFRAFIELILKKEGVFEQVLQQVLHPESNSLKEKWQ
ncbi:MAG: YrbI family 3-deoxy-D-manno-octulosonate 8-phosphate phosphatase [Maribacter sp.]|jgi:YrbI family 3-deoxy-D-manno-octulosonate 8-phosphate phosphatase